MPFMNIKNLIKIHVGLDVGFWILFVLLNAAILALATQPHPESILGDAFARPSLAPQRSLWFFIFFYAVLGVSILATLFSPSVKKMRPLHRWHPWVFPLTGLMGLLSIFFATQQTLPWFWMLLLEICLLGLVFFISRLLKIHP